MTLLASGAVSGAAGVSGSRVPIQSGSFRPPISIVRPDTFRTREAAAQHERAVQFFNDGG